MRNSALAFISALLSFILAASPVHADDNVYTWVNIIGGSTPYTDSFNSGTSGGSYTSRYKPDGNGSGQAYAKYGSESWYAAPGEGLGVAAVSKYKVGVTSYASVTDTYRLGLPSAQNPNNYAGAVLKLNLSGSMQTISDYKATQWPYYSNGSEGGYAYLGLKVNYGDTLYSSGGFIMGPSNFVYPQKDFPINGGGFMIQTDSKGNSLNIFLDPLNTNAKAAINSKVTLSGSDFSRLASINVPLYVPLPGLSLNTDQPLTIEMMSITGGMYAESYFMNTLKLDTTEPFFLYSQDSSGAPSLVHLADVGGTFGSLTGNTMPLFTPPIEPPGTTPEPISATLFLLGAGALGLKAGRRRGKK